MSRAADHRINSTNLYVETTFGNYLSFAKDIIANNSFQRKRVRSSKTVYSLLKTDLKAGCIMPPIVLAVIKRGVIDPHLIQDSELLEYIRAHTDEVLILDGMQRTYTLFDAAEEMKATSPEEYHAFLKYTLRLEVYLEINKFGVLYRMLTLNTGQTPMTLRHQLEMLYRDMLNVENHGLRLIPDTEDSPNTSNNEIPFKNAIEGFNSFLSRNELPIDREDLLENIKVLENMTEENIDHDLFEDFLRCYFQIFTALRNATNNCTISATDLSDLGIRNTPFGTTAHKVFSTSQALTGFGAAIGRMKDRHVIQAFDDVTSHLTELNNSESPEWFFDLVLKLDEIKNSAKKIGSAQRMYFQYFFRELLNPDSDSFMDLQCAVDNGYQKYCSQVY